MLKITTLLLLPLLAFAEYIGTGQLIVTSQHRLIGVPSNTTTSIKWLDLLFKNKRSWLEDLVTGDTVDIWGTVNNNNGIQVDRLLFKTDGYEDQYQLPTYDVSTVSVSLSYCDLLPSKSPDQIRDMYFGNGLSLKRLLKSCSWGYFSFDEEQNTVSDEVVDIPCQGQFNDRPYDLGNQCGSSEMLAINKYVTEHLETKGSTKVIVYLPEANPCKWSGLSTYGCSDAACIAWINMPSITSVFHELGHMMMLGHSGKGNSEEGDDTCIMGGCCGVRCLNPANAYFFYWNEVIQDLTDLNGAQALRIPEYFDGNPYNVVKYRDYYINYQTVHGGNQFLSTSFHRKIAIYKRPNKKFAHTKLVRLLDGNTQFTLEGLGIKVEECTRFDCVVVFRTMV